MALGLNLDSESRVAGELLGHHSSCIWKVWSHILTTLFPRAPLGKLSICNVACREITFADAF